MKTRYILLLNCHLRKKINKHFHNFVVFFLLNYRYVKILNLKGKGSLNACVHGFISKFHYICGIFSLNNSWCINIAIVKAHAKTILICSFLSYSSAPTELSYTVLQMLPVGDQSFIYLFSTCLYSHTDQNFSLLLITEQIMNLQ